MISRLDIKNLSLVGHAKIVGDATSMPASKDGPGIEGGIGAADLHKVRSGHDTVVDRRAGAACVPTVADVHRPFRWSTAYSARKYVYERSYVFEGVARPVPCRLRKICIACYAESLGWS